MACCNQREIVQERITIVPTHKIDTCFVVKSDTILYFETDTLRLETIIRDTLFRFKVETKPIIVRDTITKENPKKAKKKEEKAKENPKKTKTFLFFSLCFLVFLLTIRFKK